MQELLLVSHVGQWGNGVLMNTSRWTHYLHPQPLSCRCRWGHPHSTDQWVVPWFGCGKHLWSTWLGEESLLWTRRWAQALRRARASSGSLGQVLSLQGVLKMKFDWSNDGWVHLGPSGIRIVFLFVSFGIQHRSWEIHCPTISTGLYVGGHGGPPLRPVGTSEDRDQSGRLRRRHGCFCNTNKSAFQTVITSP